MRFESEFRVPGDPDTVIRHFTDIERMARCMPGAAIEGRDEDGSWRGALTVKFGPKRITFRGRFTCDIDIAAKIGVVEGRGAADLRAARIGVHLTFALLADTASADPMTIVSLVSEADLQGVLADFAKTGGVPVANAILAEFSKCVAREIETGVPAEGAASLSAGKLLGAVVRDKAAGLRGLMKRGGDKDGNES